MRDLSLGYDHIDYSPLVQADIMTTSSMSNSREILYHSIYIVVPHNETKV